MPVRVWSGGITRDSSECGGLTRTPSFAESVRRVKKSDIALIKALASPPVMVNTVFECVAVLLADPEEARSMSRPGFKSWSWTRTLLSRTGKQSFLRRLIAVDMAQPPLMLSQAMQYLDLPQFDVDTIKNAGAAAAAILVWCRSYIICQRIKLWLAPKQRALEERRTAAREQDVATEQSMALHSDVRPVVESARKGLMKEEMQENELLLRMEGGRLKEVDDAILRLLRLDEAGEKSAREAMVQLQKGLWKRAVD